MDSTEPSRTAPSQVRTVDGSPHDFDAYRTALRGHCYRMLGSIEDAEDAVQETLLKAWRKRDTFVGRASASTWLHSIATNVCLDMLRGRRRRERPVDCGPAGTVQSTLQSRPSSHWLDPVPDSWAIAAPQTPAHRAEVMQSIRLAYVAALQHLPPRQRAALLLVDVLDWSAAEVAATLETSVAAVNSALQRARAKLGARPVSSRPERLSKAERRLVSRFVEAFEAYDIDALTRLLADDARMSMPPYDLWLLGPDQISKWLLGPGIGCRGSRLRPVAANGSPAFGQYRPSPTPGAPRPAWSLIVLEHRAGVLTGLNHFLDTQRLFPVFGLPATLPS